MSNTRINPLIGGIKPRLRDGDITMITLLVGLLASSIWAWWQRRRNASKEA
jgi:hypothetical protein